MPDNEEDNEFTVNLEDKIFRLIAMILLGFILYLAFFAFVIMAAAQYFLYFVEDKPNQTLAGWLNRLRSYIRESYRYLGFATNKAPFPFSKFPEK